MQGSTKYQSLYVSNEVKIGKKNRDYIIKSSKAINEVYKVLQLYELSVKPQK